MSQLFVQAIGFPSAHIAEPKGLSINVIVPAGTKPDAKLPVAVVSLDNRFHVYPLRMRL